MRVEEAVRMAARRNLCRQQNFWRNAEIRRRPTGREWAAFLDLAAEALRRDGYAEAAHIVTVAVLAIETPDQRPAGSDNSASPEEAARKFEFEAQR
jgi:hypothetical protein